VNRSDIVFRHLHILHSDDGGNLDLHKMMTSPVFAAGSFLAITSATAQICSKKIGGQQQIVVRSIAHRPVTAKECLLTSFQIDRGGTAFHLIHA
jgi:hypothetical protein